MKLRVTPLSGLKSRILMRSFRLQGLVMIRSCARGISLTDEGRLVERLTVVSPRAVIRKCSSRSHADTIIVGRIVHRAKPEPGKPELNLIHIFFESCPILDGNA